MALNAGDADCTAGLSKTIFDTLVGLPGAGFSTPMGASQSAAVKAICFAIAQSVVQHFKDSAVVTGNVGGTAISSGRVT